MTPAAEEAQWVTFRLGQEEYAVPVADVQEILRVPAITPVPASPAFVEGVVNLRGRIVPIIDLAVRLGLPPGQEGRSRRVIVSHAGPSAVGLLVDVVTDVLPVMARSVEAAPAFLAALPHAACFHGVARWGDRLLLLLDLARVLTAEEDEALAACGAG
jgi:purine-binding chemotaxis protein CheW